MTSNTNNDSYLLERKEIILSGNIYCSISSVAEAYRQGLSDIHASHKFTDLSNYDITPKVLCALITSMNEKTSTLGRRMARTLISSAGVDGDQSAFDFIQKAMNEGLLKLMIILLEKSAIKFESNPTDEEMNFAMEITDILVSMTLAESDGEFVTGSLDELKQTKLLSMDNVPVTSKELSGYPLALSIFLRCYFFYDWKDNEQQLKMKTFATFVKLTNGMTALSLFYYSSMTNDECYELLRSTMMMPTICNISFAKAICNLLFETDASIR